MNPVLVSSFGTTSGLESCEILLSSNDCVKNNSDLRNLREASIFCVLSIQEEVANWGMRDGSWVEYDPSCIELDGSYFNVAETQNSASSLDFDEIVCEEEMEFVYSSASQLAFGSFAYHASGMAGLSDDEVGETVTHHLDTIGIQCVAAQMLFEVMRISNTSNMEVLGGYDMSLVAQCSTEYEMIMYSCDFSDGTMLADLNTLEESIPDYVEIFGLIIYILVGKCVGEAYAEYLITTEESEFLSSENMEAIFAFDLSSVQNGPSALACSQINPAIESFLGALEHQPAGVDEHDLWHTEAAESMKLFGAVINDY